MTQSNAVETTNCFIKFLTHSVQFEKILENISTNADCLFLITQFLTAKPNLLLDNSGINICGILIPFKCLYKETFVPLENLLKFQKNRKNIFNEIISQNYSIKYFNFSLNTQIDAVLPRATIVALIIRHFNTHDKAIIRAHVMKLQEKHKNEFSLKKHFSKLLF